MSLFSASFRLMEYRDMRAYDSTTSNYDNATALANQPFTINYSGNTEIATVTWTVLGTTPVNSHRIYYLYFDFSNYQKPAYNYSTINYTAPSVPVYITVAAAQSQEQTNIFDTNHAYLFNPNTLILNTVNQLSRVWEFEAVTYRKPLLYDAGAYARGIFTVSSDINFIAEFQNVGCPGCDLNTDALSLVRVNNWGEGDVLEILTLSDVNTAGTYDWTYNSTTQILSLSWVAPPTPAYGVRRYFLYFDSISGSSTLPVTTDNSSQAWAKTDQSITLSPTDYSGLGIDETYYCTESGTCTPATAYTAAIQVSCSAGSVCQKYIRYYSTDNAGNTEATQTSNLIRIDKVYPSTTDDAVADTYYYDPLIALTPADTGSGVAETYYCISSTSCSPNLVLPSDGEVLVECPAGNTCTKYINYYSIDNAGNQESTKSTVTMYINKGGTQAFSEGFEASTFPPSGWTTGGSNEWHIDDFRYWEGVQSASSGLVGDTYQSWIEKSHTFSSSGTIKFHWKVSSEPNYDYLLFCIDNAACTPNTGYSRKMSGEKAWREESVAVSAGAHTFRWKYIKNPTISYGYDRGWLDNVRFYYS